MIIVLEQSMNRSTALKCQYFQNMGDKNFNLDSIIYKFLIDIRDMMVE